jgi:hypothetical protein
VSYSGGQLDIAAPEGSYRPGARDLEFAVRSASKPRNGRIADDGKGHRIELK